MLRPPPSSTLFPYTTLSDLLLLLMLEGDPWKSQVRGAVDAEEFEFVPYREVFEAIADDAVLSLSETSAIASKDRKSTRLNSSHRTISYAVFCLKKKKTITND